MLFEKLASAIRNNVVSGLKGYTNSTSFTLEQIIDDIVDMRIALLTKYVLEGKFPLKDLMLSINCISVDCKNLEKCNKCAKIYGGTPTAHFEIPQLFTGVANNGIEYIGSPDKQNPFAVYTSATGWRLDKYKRRKKREKPYVFVDTTPNENGMNDCFIFNAPYIKQVTVVAVFKDLRQLEELGCCDQINDDNINFLNSDIKKALTEQYLRYYRMGGSESNNNQQAKP